MAVIDNDMSEVNIDAQLEYGDRRQECVFIGVNRDRKWIEDELNLCLLTDSKMADGPQYWLEYNDGLPTDWVIAPQPVGA